MSTLNKSNNKIHIGQGSGSKTLFAGEVKNIETDQKDLVITEDELLPPDTGGAWFNQATDYTKIGDILLGTLDNKLLRYNGSTIDICTITGVEKLTTIGWFIKDEIVHMDNSYPDNSSFAINNLIICIASEYSTRTSFLYVPYVDILWDGYMSIPALAINFTGVRSGYHRAEFADPFSIRYEDSSSADNTVTDIKFISDAYYEQEFQNSFAGSIGNSNNYRINQIVQLPTGLPEFDDSSAFNNTILIQIDKINGGTYASNESVIYKLKLTSLLIDDVWSLSGINHENITPVFAPIDYFNTPHNIELQGQGDTNTPIGNLTEGESTGHYYNLTHPSGSYQAVLENMIHWNYIDEDNPDSMGEKQGAIYSFAVKGSVPTDPSNEIQNGNIRYYNILHIYPKSYPTRQMENDLPYVGLTNYYSDRSASPFIERNSIVPHSVRLKLWSLMDDPEVVGPQDIEQYFGVNIDVMDYADILQNYTGNFATIPLANAELALSYESGGNIIDPKSVWGYKPGVESLSDHWAYQDERAPFFCLKYFTYAPSLTTAERFDSFFGLYSLGDAYLEDLLTDPQYVRQDFTVEAACWENAARPVGLYSSTQRVIYPKKAIGISATRHNNMDGGGSHNSVNVKIGFGIDGNSYYSDGVGLEMGFKTPRAAKLVEGIHNFNALPYSQQNAWHQNFAGFYSLAQFELAEDNYPNSLTYYSTVEPYASKISDETQFSKDTLFIVNAPNEGTGLPAALSLRPCWGNGEIAGAPVIFGATAVGADSFEGCHNTIVSDIPQEELKNAELTNNPLIVKGTFTAEASDAASSVKFYYPVTFTKFEDNIYTGPHPEDVTCINTRIPLGAPESPNLVHYQTNSLLGFNETYPAGYLSWERSSSARGTGNIEVSYSPQAQSGAGVFQFASIGEELESISAGTVPPGNTWVAPLQASLSTVLSTLKEEAVYHTGGEYRVEQYFSYYFVNTLLSSFHFFNINYKPSSTAIAADANVHMSDFIFDSHPINYDDPLFSMYHSQGVYRQIQYFYTSENYDPTFLEYSPPFSSEIFRHVWGNAALIYQHPTTGSISFTGSNSGDTKWDWGTISPWVDTQTLQIGDAKISDNTDGWVTSADLDGEALSLTADSFPVGAADAGYENFVAPFELVYKVSFTYDGFQESPLIIAELAKSTEATNSKKYFTVQINFDLRRLSKRVSHINIYRKYTQGEGAGSDINYKLVQSKALDPVSSFVYSGDGRLSFSFVDYNNSAPSYDAIVGISETLKNTTLSYDIGTTGDGYLFVTNAQVPMLTDDFSHYIFRSMPNGRFSQFNWPVDNVRLPAKPISLQSHNGRLYAFSKSKIMVINQSTLEIEDVFEGAGCLNKNCVISTEYGMYVVDNYNIYGITQSGPEVISAPIANMWTDAVLDPETQIVYPRSNEHISFDNKRKSVLVFYTLTGPNNSINSECLSYNILKRRWDKIDVAARGILNTYINNEGEVMYSTTSGVFRFLADTNNRRNWSWESKALVLSSSSQDKKLKNIKLLANNDLSAASISTILDNKTGIDVIESTDLSEGANNSLYEVEAKRKDNKFKRLKIKIDNALGDTEVDSIAIVYKGKKVK
jgi:hypothetical protein